MLAALTVYIYMYVYYFAPLVPLVNFDFVAESPIFLHIQSSLAHHPDTDHIILALERVRITGLEGIAITKTN